MTTKVNALAAMEKGAALTPFEYELAPLEAGQVLLTVEYCGICASDLHMMNNNWGFSSYPLVPGHEVIGKVESMGSAVKTLKIGQRVGLGWHHGYCNACNQCRDGDNNMCANSKPTIAGHHGGFANKVTCDANAAIPIPESMNPATVGPLLCGGITVFTPLVEFNVSPTAKVGVVGIGGLGHMALKMLNAWGCHTTAFTSTDSKAAEAKKMGATDVINSTQPEAIAAAASTFDLIIVTVAVKLDWANYIAALAPRGRLHFVGTVPDFDVSVMSLMMGMKSISSSPVGSPKNIEKMLKFCAAHNIEPMVEEFPMAKANEACTKVDKGTIRYRAVLKM